MAAERGVGALEHRPGPVLRSETRLTLKRPPSVSVNRWPPSCGLLDMLRRR